MDIAGLEMNITEIGTGGPVFILLQGAHDDGGTGARMKEENAGPCVLAVHCVDDWDAELSPWEAVVDGREFAGEGPELLVKVCDAASELRAMYPGRPVYIAGYSLAGLFALWALYEDSASDIKHFDGAVSCSGSLWFPGWEEYVKKAAAPDGSAVYLSLGGKEANSKSTVMATVLDMYRLTDRCLKADSGVTRRTFEMNPGGHFADPEGRVIKGIRWICAR